MLVFLHLFNLFNLVSQKRKAGYDYGTITSSKIGYSGDTFMITCISATEPVWQVQNPYRIALEPISSQHIKWGNNLFLQNVTFIWITDITIVVGKKGLQEMSCSIDALLSLLLVNTLFYCTLP